MQVTAVPFHILRTIQGHIDSIKYKHISRNSLKEPGIDNVFKEVVKPDIGPSQPTQ
jgi:hypothetical protein